MPCNSYQTEVVEFLGKFNLKAKDHVQQTSFLWPLRV